MTVLEGSNSIRINGEYDIEFIMHSPLIRALQNPAIYPHPVDQIELMETHISWVLLAGDYVYKIKKPVDLGFVDFSTLEKRRHFCQEELRLNQRHAADLYIDVVSLGGQEDSPIFDAEKDVIEYAVRMHRFDSGQEFDRLLDDGRLENDHVRALARQLADLHEQAEVAKSDSDFGSFHQVAEPMRDNLDVLNRLLPESEQARIETLRAWTESALETCEPLIHRRLANGFVRECHGDAHLGNVTIFNGRVRLFDCIEFSEQLRWIDVMNDLAFTVMDLHDRGASELAWLLLDEYLSRTGDFKGLGLLRLYAVYRALVRAKVLALQLKDRELAEHKQQQIAGEIRDYLALAERLISPDPPQLVVTLGVSGSGKSWMAKRLLQSCGMIRLRSDVERKRLFELAADADSGSSLAGGIYSDGATEKTYTHLLDTARIVLEYGYPVIVDATFIEKVRRDAFRQLAGDMNVPFRLLYCLADEKVLRQRIQARNAKGEDPSEAGLEVLSRQMKSFEPPGADEVEYTLKIDTEDPNTLEQAMNGLSASATP